MNNASKNTTEQDEPAGDTHPTLVTFIVAAVFFMVVFILFMPR